MNRQGYEASAGILSRFQSTCAYANGARVSVRNIFFSKSSCLLLSLGVSVAYANVNHQHHYKWLPGSCMYCTKGDTWLIVSFGRATKAETVVLLDLGLNTLHVDTESETGPLC